MDAGEAGRSDPLIGRSIGSGYVLQELVGLGGMGRVYRAEQAALGRTVAVKVIHPHLLGDERTVSRFYQEARAASTINHPNSVGVIDFGRTEDGILYLVMEFLEGRDLADVLHEEGPLPLGRVVSILLSVLDALAEAHALGVVHRDLKPENIILRRHRSGREIVKVVDFGLATVLRAGEESGITQPGAVCGTPDYMAPEQARGQEVDGRADLYAVGVILYELLTGQLPFEAPSPTAVVMRHLHDPVPDPREVAPEGRVPDVLAAIAMKAMAKEPAERFQSAEEMREALQGALSELAATRTSGEYVPCPRCGAMNPDQVRFCGACGARVTGRMVAVREPPTRRRSRPPSEPPEEPFVGFEEELGRLRHLWRADEEGHRVVVLRGELGSGRSRLAVHFASEVREQGGIVLWARPHDSGARVAGGALRPLLATMLEASSPEELARFASEQSPLPPAARRGVADLLEPEGLEADVPRPRTEAVVAALRAAAARAQRRAPSGRLLVVVDDADRYDGLSRRAVAGWAREGLLPQCMMIVVLSSHGRLGDVRLEEIGVGGWSQQEAERYVRAVGGQVEAAPSIPPPASQAGARVSPLYVNQVVRLGLSLREAQALEPRLADVVARRVERLDPGARELLQAVSVLGSRVPLERLWRLLGREDPASLAELRHHHLVGGGEDWVEVAHPFLAQLVEAAIPAGVRRDLHRRALRLATEEGAPIEVRAEHAYRSGDVMAALLLLEGMGDRASRRGLYEDAVLAYRRALELVRRAMYEQRDVADERAFVLFSCKLGEAMERAGDLVGADGVLREALEYVGPADASRGRLALALGRVARLRERPREAQRWLREAVEVGTRHVDREVAARAQLELARLRRDQGDVLGAANAYRVAVEALDEAGAPPGWRVTARLEQAAALLDVGDEEGSERALRGALRIAEGSGIAALAARARGELGSLLEVRGERHSAADSYARAAQEAVSAGDVAAYERWRRAAEALGAAA